MFKSILCICTTIFEIDEGKIIKKRDALMIANEAQKEGILDKKSNTISGFKVVGLYPLILPEIQARIWMFQDSCIEESFWKP